MNLVNIQPEVEEKEWNEDIHKMFVYRYGELISDLITEGTERDRRLKVKALINKLIEFTREY